MQMTYCLAFMKECFVEAKKDEKFYFRDGRKYTGTHTRFIMEHAVCRGKVSGLQMWEFVHKCANKELGLINHYVKQKKSATMSRRMLALTRRVSKKWAHILYDVPGARLNSTCLNHISHSLFASFTHIRENAQKSRKDRSLFEEVVQSSSIRHCRLRRQRG